jgi:hypothetical protein
LTYSFSFFWPLLLFYRVQFEVLSKNHVIKFLGDRLFRK